MQAFLTRRRPVASLAAVAIGCAGAFTSLSVQAASTPPALRITSPGLNQLFRDTGSVTFAGTASDGAGVTGISYQVEERETSSYLHAGMTWSSRPSFSNGVLAAPGVTTSTWSVTLPALPSGDYVLNVHTAGGSGKSATASVEFGVGAAPTISTPGYLTLMFGRAEWVAASSNCVPVPGQPTLITIAQALAAESPPRTGVADPVTDWLGTGSETCVHHDPYPTWSDLDTLKNAYGWEVASEGESHTYMTTLTTAQQIVESCGALTNPDGFYAHGFGEAWGMFSYANNEFTTAIQTGVVAKCYAFGRTYKGGRNVLGKMLPNDMQVTNSILGGTCNESTLSACPAEKSPTHNRKGNVIYYDPPSALVNLMNVAANQWVVVQMYKLVTGSCATTTKSCGGLAWNCNGAWQTHWTSKPELYCEPDYLAAVASIPANVLTVDPATVAEAWDINPAVTQAPVPAVTAVSPGGGVPTGGTSVNIMGSGFTGAAGVAFGSSQATLFTVDSDDEITATAPRGAGTEDVVVTTTRGISAINAADQYIYADAPAVSVISPTGGPEAGGTPVTITGTGFTAASTAMFGTVSGTDVVVVSDTEITVQSPPGTATVDVTVTTASGTSATISADQFTYTP